MEYIYCVYVETLDPDGNKIKYPLSNPTFNKELAKQQRNIFEDKNANYIKSLVSKKDHGMCIYTAKNTTYSVESVLVADSLEEMTKDIIEF